MSTWWKQAGGVRFVFLSTLSSDIISLLSSVTQMLTTQADRFSAEEVYYHISLVCARLLAVWADPNCLTRINITIIIINILNTFYPTKSSVKLHSTFFNMHLISHSICYSWGVQDLINVMVKSACCLLDGADVCCLPPRCGRQPGLQEPGAHHYPWRGKGPRVALFTPCVCQVERPSYHLQPICSLTSALRPLRRYGLWFICSAFMSVALFQNSVHSRYMPALHQPYWKKIKT